MEKQSKSLFFSFCLTVVSVCFLALGHPQADSLWPKETAVSLYTDHKAKRVGDIITVIVLESNSASRNSSAKTEKKSDINASISDFINPNLAARFLARFNRPSLAPPRKVILKVKVRSIIQGVSTQGLPLGWWTCCQTTT